MTDTGVNAIDLIANADQPGEIPSNADDDGNGYIDDIHGFNTLLGNGHPLTITVTDRMCRIIGAAANNGVGIAGVNWRCKIVALKFAGPTVRTDLGGH